MKHVVVLLLAASIGCGGQKDGALSRHGFIGTELSAPLPLPSQHFTDSRGHPFRFDSATAGKVALVFFGYSHCPDVCPVHLANLAAVLDKMPEEIQRQVTVVFVTIDPQRDSLPVLDAWVHGFDPDFIGLTAAPGDIAAAQREVKLPSTGAVVGAATGEYTIGHLTPVIAYTRDGVGRVEYPFGTRQKDWAHDLPLLVAYGDH